MQTLIALIAHVVSLSMETNSKATESIYSKPPYSTPSTVRFESKNQNQPRIREIKVEGDIMFGGLFPIHEAGSELEPCGAILETRGIQRTEAMLYALDKINENPRILGGIKVGALILDTCSQAAFALNQSLTFVRDLIGVMDVEDHYTCPDDATPKLLHPPQPVAGVIGAQSSTVSIQVANLLRLFGIVQISPAATAPDLSEKTKYEYFARTVPSDSFQAQAMADIANYFNWSYVSLVYTGDDYGQLGADAFKRAARHQNICIADDAKITDRKDLPEIVTSLRRAAAAKKEHQNESGAKVVILYTNRNDTTSLLHEFSRQQKEASGTSDVIWLASENWEMQEKTTRGAEEIAKRALVLSIESQPVDEFEHYYNGLQPSSAEFERNKWLREFWEHKNNCSLPGGGNSKSANYTPRFNRTCSPSLSLSTKKFDSKIQFVIDAVYALAHALDMMWKDVCWNKTDPVTGIMEERPTNICTELKDKLSNKVGPALYQTFLLNVTFKGISNKTFKFDHRGDGPAHYSIMQYGSDYEYRVVGKWRDGMLEVEEGSLAWSNSSVPLSRCSSQCPLGYVKRVIKSDDICCWACIPCADHAYMVNETTCRDCEWGQWPFPNRTACYNISDVNLKHMQWNKIYSIVPAALAAFGILLTSTVIAVYAKYNDTPVVKASGRELSYILLGGMIVCYLMTFVLLAKPTPILCGLKRVGVGLGFAILYAAMLVKTNRIYRIFSSAKRSAARPIFISPISQVVITGVLAGVQLVGSIVWMIISHPDTRLDTPSREEVVLKCKVVDHWFLVSLCYDGLLILTCTIYAIKTRKVPENFNEAKFIGFTMYTTCIIWLAFVPIYFGTGSDFQIQTTTLCISISLSATVALFCLYSPKLWIILMEPEKNVRKTGGTMMGTKQPTSDSPSIYSPLLSTSLAKPDIEPRHILNNEKNEIGVEKRRRRTMGGGERESLESLTSL